MPTANSSRFRALWLLLAAFVALSILSAVRITSTIGQCGPEVSMDPNATFSSFSLWGWAPKPSPLRFPDQLIAIDGAAAPSRFANRWALERFQQNCAHGRFTVRMTFATSRGVVEVAPTLGRRTANHLIPLLLLHLGIAFALLGCGTLVLMVARDRSSSQWFFALCVVGAVFLVTLLEYHTAASMQSLFVLGFGLSSALLLRLPMAIPWRLDAPRLERIANALTVILAGLTIVAFIQSIGGHTARWLRVLFSIVTPSGLLLLACRVFWEWSRSSGHRRRSVRSLVIGVIFVPVVLAVLQLLIWTEARPLLHLATPVAGSAIVLGVGIAMLRYNLFDSNTVVLRENTTIPTISISVAIGLIIWMLLSMISAPNGQLTGNAVSAGAAAICSFITLRRLLDGFLFRAAETYRPLIRDLVDQISRLHDRPSIEAALTSTLTTVVAFELISVANSESEQTSRYAQKLFAGEIVWEQGDTPRILVPMTSLGELRGVLSITPRRGSLVSDDDVFLAYTVASVGAVALHHAAVLAEREELRRVERSAQETDRRTLLGTFAGEILHELQTPIHFLKSVIRENRDTPHPDEDDTREIAREEAERLERLVIAARHMRLPDLIRGPLSLHDLVESAVHIVDVARAGVSASCAIDVDASLVVSADRDRLRQVLINLLRNAHEAVDPTHGSIGIRARWSGAGSNSTLMLDVWDDGPGVDASIAPQLFRAFRSTRSHGTGLGLVVCARVIGELGWEIDYVREDDRTCFRISIPCSDVESGTPSVVHDQSSTTDS